MKYKDKGQGALPRKSSWSHWLGAGCVATVLAVECASAWAVEPVQTGFASGNALFGQNGSSSVALGFGAANGVYGVMGSQLYSGMEGVPQPIIRYVAGGSVSGGTVAANGGQSSPQPVGSGVGLGRNPVVTVVANTPGSLAIGSTNAVNGSQLYATGNSNAVNVSQLGVVLGTNPGSPVGSNNPGSVAIGKPNVINGSQLGVALGTNPGSSVGTNNLGSVAIGSTNAVNGSQLYAGGLFIPGQGTVNVIGNVAVGSPNAVNGSQLYGTAVTLDNGATTVIIISGANGSGNGNVALGKPDSPSGGTALPLGTDGKHTEPKAEGGTQSHNPANGSASIDAASVGQMESRIAEIDAKVDQVNSKMVTVGQVDAKVAEVDAKLDQVSNKMVTAINGVNTRVDRLSQQVAENRKEANAGVADAVAMANLPQATAPGKGAVAVGVGYRGGESSLAVGLSRVHENGKWIFRFSGAVNTQSNASVGAGVAYQW